MPHTSTRVILLASLALPACANTIIPITPVIVQTVYSSAWCNGAERAGIQRITAEELLRVATSSRTVISDVNTPLTIAPEHSLLQLNMGQLSSAGYAIEVMRAETSGQKLTLHITWHEPIANSMTAQMLTQPCVVIALDLRDIHYVQVVDQNQSRRFDLALPPTP